MPNSREGHRGWTWLECGCVTCFQGPNWPGSPSTLCAVAQALDDRRRALIIPRCQPGLRDAWVAVQLHYGVSPAYLDAVWPRYGWTPYGRPIRATTDPDYGRARCACGFAWAREHARGCPHQARHLRLVA
jgi:hypothetical protein